MTKPEREDAELPQARPRFEQLYEDHFQSIYSFVLRRREAQEVGDLVADVFAVVWRRIADVPEPPEDRLWLYGVARRVLSQDGRARGRRLSLVTRLTQTRPLRPDSDIDEPEAAQRLRELIGHLKPLDQEIVRLVAWESLSHAEAAQVLNCSANTVAIRWHRSVERLRKAMDAPSLRPESDPDAWRSSRKEAPDAH